MQMTDTLLGGFNLGIECLSRSSTKIGDNHILYRYNHLVIKYNELSSVSSRVVNVLYSKNQNLEQENFLLKKEIARLKKLSNK